MCDMCYGYIYDIITSPIHDSHTLHKHIHRPSLLLHANELAHCFQRALNKFDNNPLFFVIMDDPDDYITDEMDNTLRETMEDKWAWKTFLHFYPNGAAEISHAMDICMDNSIFRKTSEPCRIIEQFTFDRLRVLLSTIPDIHKAHTEKVAPDRSHSLGPASLQKIANLRSNLGLAVSNWERTTAIDNILGGV